MFARTTCFASLLAGALPLLGTAQTTAPAATSPRFYVGLNGSTNTNSQLYGPLKSSSVVPGLTFGVQLQPRLAVQASINYRQKTRPDSFASQRADDTGQLQPGYWHSTSTSRYLSVPILARYTLTPLDRRWAVDMLGGFTIRRSSYKYEENFTFDQTQRTVGSDFATDYTDTDGFVTLGPSLRYRVGSRFDLTGDVMFNYLLGRPYTSSYDQLTGTLMLGARYRFGK